MVPFVLVLNPPSHFLRLTKKYAYGKNGHCQHTHTFFDNYLKLYATDMNTVKRQLE